MKYEQHPLSAAFPAMSADDYQTLKDSINEIGVQNPITLFEGMVIDGWHRYRAANELGMECPTVELGDVDPRDFVLAQNKARRHVTQAQLAQAAIAVFQWYPADGSAQKNGGAAGPAAPPKSTKEIADIAGVSERTVRQAKAIQKKAAPEVVEAVKRGEIGGEKASAIAKLPKEQQAEAIKKPIEKPAKPQPEDEAYAPPAPANHELEEAISTINELAAENEQLRDRVAVAAMSGTDEERAMAAETIAELRDQIKTLEAELDAVRTSRDTFQRQNAELMKQVRLQQKQIKKLGG